MLENEYKNVWTIGYAFLKNLFVQNIAFDSIL